MEEQGRIWNIHLFSPSFEELIPKDLDIHPSLLYPSLQVGQAAAAVDQVTDTGDYSHRDKTGAADRLEASIADKLEKLDSEKVQPVDGGAGGAVGVGVGVAAAGASGTLVTSEQDGGKGRIEKVIPKKTKTGKSGSDRQRLVQLDFDETQELWETAGNVGCGGIQDCS